MNKIKNILKCINIFSFGNKTYQNINSEDSKMLLNFSLNNCGELWNDLKFKKAIDSLKHLKSKMEERKSKLDILLYEARLYYSIEDNEEGDKILLYIEKEFDEELKNSISYFELKFFQEPKNSTIKEILKNEFGKDEKELYIEELYFTKQYDKFIKEYEKNNIQINEEIRYLLLKLMMPEINDEFERFLVKIKEVLKEESTFFKLYIMSKIINFFFCNFQLYLKEFLVEFLEEYVEIFEKSVDIENLIESQNKKTCIYNMINMYVSSSLLIFKDLNQKKEILIKYKSFLDSSNRLNILLLENGGYQSYIKNVLRTADTKNLDIEIFLNSLFLNKKYKQVLQLIKKEKIEETPQIKSLQIFCKIFKNLDLNKEEDSFLEHKKEEMGLEFLFYYFISLKNNKILISEFKKNIMKILTTKINDFVILILLRLIYYIDNYWIIDFFIKEQDKYRHFIPEIIDILSEDNKILGIKFEEFINRINMNNLNINFSNIGKAYIEYKNPKRALHFFLKQWKINKNTEVALSIFNLCLLFEEFNEEVYEYLKNDKLDLEKEFLLNVFLYFKDQKEAIKNINKFFLFKPFKELEKIKILIGKFYVKYLLKSNKNIFENTLYIVDNKTYIPDIYLKNISLENHYLKMDLDKFNIFEREKIHSKENLLIHLVLKFINELGGLDKMIKDLPGVKSLSINTSADKKDFGVSFIDLLEEATGEKELKKLRKEYLEINNYQGKVILMDSLYFNFQQLNIFLEEYITRFNKNYINSHIQEIGSKKIISPDSIVFLYKLNLLEFIKYLNNIYFQKSTYNFFKESINEPEVLDIIKILDDLKNTKMIDDENVNTLIKNKETPIFFNRLISLSYKNEYDYISEDRNLKKVSNIVNSYSSLFLIISNYDYIKRNYNLEKLNNLLAKIIVVK
ncbi:hypothetical protein YWH7199_11560 [Fusobacterium nucleatum YWH7199]|uniref:hypothetical protein n=1 Tax=Fusobacterium nucleatum TaxID=851 RepID=UPI00201AE4E3|nr:hypothetical protein [Fusobacterium nucleatum]MCL4581942.1 hypothetical protein [Fusobacterium nucleatum YWH7199]